MAIMSTSSSSLSSSSFTEESSFSTHDETTPIQQKSLLMHQEDVVKSLLAEHNGSTKNPKVLDAIHKLASMNPTQDVASSPFLEGEFLCHTLPEFPGRITRNNNTQNQSSSASSPSTVPSNNTVQYTLGRLSFGVFQPHHLVCTVRSVRQSVHGRASVKNNNNNNNNNKTTGNESIIDRSKFRTFDYPICLDLTIHTPSGHDLPAIMYQGGVCYKDPNNNNNNKNRHQNQQPQRLNVIFKGSTLLPSPQVRDDPQLLKVWKDTFRDAYKNAAKERGFFKKAIQMAITWWFQMVLPTDFNNDATTDEEEDLSVNFEMKRPPRGWLQVLYLSERMRITKGNRGTLVVVERLTTTKTTNTSVVKQTQENDNKAFPHTSVKE